MSLPPAACLQNLVLHSKHVHYEQAPCRQWAAQACSISKCRASPTPIKIQLLQSLSVQQRQCLFSRSGWVVCQ